MARSIWPFSSNTIALSRNSPAQPLRFIRVAFHGRCPAGVTCAYPEVFTVEIPEVELRQAAPEGYRFKVFARLGPDAEVIIPKVQIAALLARIDGQRLPASSRRLRGPTDPYCLDCACVPSRGGGRRVQRPAPAIRVPPRGEALNG